MKYIKAYFIIILLLFIYINIKAQSYSTLVEVISSGGGESTGSNYTNFGVLGETFVDLSISGGNYSTSLGFISTFEPCIITSISTHPASQTVCEGSDVSLNVTAIGTDLSYQWQKNGVNIIDSTNTSLNFASVSLNDAADYTVLVSGVYGDPVTSNIASLIINALPIINITGDNPVCSGIEKMYSTENNADHTYQWTIDGGSIISGQNTNQVNVEWDDLSQGMIYLTETINSTGCFAIEDSVITINPAPDIQSIFGENTACANTTLSYGVVNEQNNLVWQTDGGLIDRPNEKLINIIWNQTGENEIRLTETNSYGCTVESILLVNVADNELLDVPEIKVKFNSLLIGTNLLDAFVSYQWYNEEGLISGATEQFYDAPLPLSGEYYLIATDNNTCKAESNHLVFDGSKSHKSILAYPNPASDELSIQFTEQGHEDISVRLFNNTGQAVIIKTIYNGNYLKKINTADLSEGIYFLNIESNGEIIYSEKIIVQH